MNIKVNYKNEVLDHEKGTLLNELAKKYKNDYKYNILVATLDNKVVSLDTKLNRNCTIDFFDISSVVGSNAYERGIIFLFSNS